MYIDMNVRERESARARSACACAFTYVRVCVYTCTHAKLRALRVGGAHMYVEAMSLWLSALVWSL